MCPHQSAKLLQTFDQHCFNLSQMWCCDFLPEMRFFSRLILKTIPSKTILQSKSHSVPSCWCYHFFWNNFWLTPFLLWSTLIVIYFGFPHWLTNCAWLCRLSQLSVVLWLTFAVVYLIVMQLSFAVIYLMVLQLSFAVAPIAHQSCTVNAAVSLWSVWAMFVHSLFVCWIHFGLQERFFHKRFWKGKDDSACLPHCSPIMHDCCCCWFVFWFAEEGGVLGSSVEEKMIEEFWFAGEQSLPFV